jgi:thiamine-monophosphate kinase
MDCHDNTMAIHPPGTISMMKESELLAWLYKSTSKSPAVPLPVGDDMAGIRLPKRVTRDGLTLLKIDQCLDMVHFDLSRHTPEQIGRKAVNRCFSDCAAMAALPVAVLISVALPMATRLPWAKKMLQGCRTAARQASCSIVGGDTALWDQRLAISVAAVGVPAKYPVLRSGAQPGDALCVSGRLGGSILGRHLSFSPRILLAQRLAEMCHIHSMMDISDGLAIDLPRLLSMSGVGARVDAGRIPIHVDARRLAQQDGLGALHHALCDGEDYELLFTLSRRDAAKVRAARLPVRIVGDITATRNEIVLSHDEGTQPWPAGGWDHGVKPAPAAGTGSNLP